MHVLRRGLSLQLMDDVLGHFLNVHISTQNTCCSPFSTRTARTAVWPRLSGCGNPHLGLRKHIRADVVRHEFPLWHAAEPCMDRGCELGRIVP